MPAAKRKPGSGIRWKQQPLWAFYTSTGVGFLMYQDERGHSVASGEVAIQRWRALGMPNVASYAHAVQLGLVTP